MRPFIFVVDSFANEFLETLLAETGLAEGEEYHVTGAGGSGILLRNPKWLSCEKLLVFTGSFHGSTDKAIDYAKQIKEANPGAKIIFRSATEYTDDPIFDGHVGKDREGFDKMRTIIQDFLGEKAVSSVSDEA